jgi:uncharacterized protein (UPF0261 family)
MMNREGMPLYDEAANKGFEDTLKEQLKDDVGLLVRDKHINDEAFADDVVELFMKLWDKQHPEDEASGG